MYLSNSFVIWQTENTAFHEEYLNIKFAQRNSEPFNQLDRLLF